MAPSKMIAISRHGSLGSALRLRSDGKAVIDIDSTNGTRMVAFFIVRAERHILLKLDDLNHTGLLGAESDGGITEEKQQKWHLK